MNPSTLLARWAVLERDLLQAKQDRDVQTVREIIQELNVLRALVREMDDPTSNPTTPDEKLLGAVFGQVKVDLTQWAKFLPSGPKTVDVLASKAVAAQEARQKESGKDALYRRVAAACARHMDGCASVADARLAAQYPELWARAEGDLE